MVVWLLNVQLLSLDLNTGQNVQVFNDGISFKEVTVIRFLIHCLKTGPQVEKIKP